MNDLSKKIKTRFLKSKDIFITAKNLEKEGYTIVGGIYDASKEIWYMNVFKDNNKIVQVLYSFRHDESNYKQFIHSILY